MPSLPLPHQMYLLSHHPEKGRLDDASAAARGSLLCGAAVAELRLTGWLQDRHGRAERTTAAPETSLDPFLAEMLGDARPHRPRTWFELLEQRWLRAEDAVRDQLVAAGAVTVEHRRIMGVVPAEQIDVTDPASVRGLRDRVREAAQREPGAGSPPIGDAVLAVLAIEGNVSTVFGWRDLWGHKSAVRALKIQVDLELPGLRSALVNSIALRRAG